MIATKHLSLAAIVLLTACASHHPATETAPATMGGGKNLATNSLKSTNQPLESTTEQTKSSPTTKKIAGASPTAVSSWEISGAMAARNKAKGWSATLNWVQNGPGQYQIRLFGPLGSGTVMINKKGGIITYRDGPKTITASNADDLLKKQTGVRLPVSNLFYWVRGLPSPGAVQSAQRDQANNLIVLRQGGYTIDYAQYTTVGSYVLPRQIRLQGNGAFIKLVIRQWRI